MYAVTAFKQGCIIATLFLIAADALAAIEAAEKQLRLKMRTYQISEGKNKTRKVSWTGVEFTARRIRQERIRKVNEEFVPLVDTDKISYDILAQENVDLLLRIKEAMGLGANAALVEKWAKFRFANSTTRDMVIGAAHYIERASKVE